MSKSSGKIIFHIDMNAFFCSVACNLDPSLRGKPFAIGRENSYKGVIATASYEARAYGINSAMSLAEAYRRLPSLLVISIDYSHYQEYHKKFVSLISKYTSLIEVGSIDEVYCDMTELADEMHPLVLAKEIQSRLLSELGLPASIGIGPTLFLAKMASDMKKPLGVTVLRKRDVVEKLYPLSVKDIFGIGKKTYPRLIASGINTIGDFMRPENKELLLSLVGDKTYSYVIDAVSGRTTNVVDPNRNSESMSISTSSTYDVFKTTLPEIIFELRRMARGIHNKMVFDGYFTKTVSITLRDSDFNTITRQKTLNDYTDSLYELIEAASDLAEEYFTDGKSYRLIGIGVSKLRDKEEIRREYNLFNLPEEISKVDNINSLMREMTEKFGDKALFWNKSKK